MTTFIQKYAAAPLNAPPTDITQLRMGLDNEEGTAASHGARPDLVAMWSNSLPTIAALRSFAVDANTPDGSMRTIRGHSQPGVGHGSFVLNKSGTIGANADNNGTIIHAAGGPVITDPAAWYWLRQFNDDLIITPHMFGFIDDFDGITGTDNAPAVQAAFDAAAAINPDNLKTNAINDVAYPTVRLPRSKGYYCQETIYCDAYIHVEMDSPIVHDKNESSIGIVVGQTGPKSRNSNVRLRLRVTRKSGDTSDWTNEGSIGAQVISLESSQLYVAIGELGGGFTIGVQCIGVGTGFVNSAVDFGIMRNNKIACDCTNKTEGGAHTGGMGATTLVDSTKRWPVNALQGETVTNVTDGSSGTVTANTRTTLTATLTGGTNNWDTGDVYTLGPPGWCNDSSFSDGRFNCGSGVNVSLVRYGFRWWTMDGTGPGAINNNRFEKNSIELQSNGIPIWVVNGNKNLVEQARDEGNGSVFAIIEDSAGAASKNIHNRFHLGRGLGTLEERGDASRNVITHSETSHSQETLRIIHDSDNIPANMIAYDGTNSSCKNMHFATVSANSDAIFGDSSFVWYVDEICTFDDIDNEVDHVGHTRQNGDVVFLTTTGTLPGTLSTDTEYFVVNAKADHFQISLTRNGSPETDFSGGSGTHSYVSRNRYVEFDNSRAMGFFVDTSQCKRLLVVRDTETGNPGRIRILAYTKSGFILQDEATFTVDDPNNELIQTDNTLIVNDRLTFSSTGTLPAGLDDTNIFYVISKDDTATGRFRVSLTEGGPAVTDLSGGSGTHTYHMVDPYIRGNNTSISTFKGGSFTQGSDAEEEYYVRVRAEVDYVEILISGGTVPCRLRRLQCYTRGALPTESLAPRSWLTGENDPDKHWVTQAPAFGPYRGTWLVYDITPASAAPMGWALSAGGVSGTWLAMANYA